jgi:MoxR-like ATPase
MENDKFVRITTGKLPEAHIAFIDECFKANAPVLNIMLPIMNEKIFYNDGKPNDIPLMTMIGASNEGPQDESLAAFYDRFLFRINVHYVKDAANKKRMYTNYVNERRGVTNLAGKTTITIEEIQALTEASKSIVVPKGIINKFVKFTNDLGKQTIHISDRRQNECFKILQASAIIHGRQQVGIDDFKSLIYVLWDKEEQIPLIESTITKMINPFDDQFKGFKDNFNIIKKDIDSTTDENEKTTKSLEAKSSIEKLTSKLNRLINEASKNGKDITDFTAFRDEMIAYSNKVVQDALGASLGIDTDEDLL